MLLMNNGVGDSEPVTADVRVRRAVAAALDVDVINRRQFGGDGLPTTALVHPDSPLFPGIEGPEHDPALAARLVQEVKDETGWDGRIRLLCNDLTDRRDAALAIESLLNAVGMRVQTTIGTTAELIAGVITNRDYDLACWAAAYTESDVWFNLSIFTSGSPTNYSGIQDEQMDAVLTRLQAAGTLEERRDALRAMQERWNEIVPSAIWGAAETYVAHTDRVHGLIPTVRQTFLFHNAYVE
jgi:peptide/nickel transport system substrate-binding protein